MCVSFWLVQSLKMQDLGKMGVTGFCAWQKNVANLWHTLVGQDPVPDRRVW